MGKGTNAGPPLTVDRRGFVKLAGVAAAAVGAPATAALAQAGRTERVTPQPAPPLVADENTADILVDTLITWGATHVFGIVGDGINPIVEALRKRQDEIAFIGVRHEEAAAFMAGGVAKHGGRLGVCLATTGPGAVHLMNGLYDAVYDCDPEGLHPGRLDPLGHDFVQAMGGTGVSKSRVSRLCQEIDERVGAFLDRPIESEWPYLWMDATYVKVRQTGVSSRSPSSWRSV